MAKGSPYEREISRILSLWVSDNERDDTVWRSQTSGARAKTRSKKGLTLEGQYGDLASTADISKALFDICTFELKRGYKKWSFLDILDKSERGAQQTFEGFVEQVCEDAELSSREPVLICRRDKRNSVIVIRKSFYLSMEDYHGSIGNVRYITINLNDDKEPWIAFRLEEFLDWCNPTFFEYLILLKNKRRGRKRR